MSEIRISTKDILYWNDDLSDRQFRTLLKCIALSMLLDQVPPENILNNHIGHEAISDLRKVFDGNGSSVSLNQFLQEEMERQMAI